MDKENTNKEYEELIKKLRSEKNSKEAYIGFFQTGEDRAESFIKANKQGLEYFAADLLEATLTTLPDDRSGPDLLTQTVLDLDSDINFEYIQLETETRENIKPFTEYKETFKEKVTKYGCISIAIFLVFLFIVGVVTFISWYV